jgi:hypothetical protein
LSSQRLSGRFFFGGWACLCAAAWFAPPVCAGDNWSGSIRAKTQIDNRYGNGGRAFGETWGQFFYDNADLDLHGALDMVGRLGSVSPYTRDASGQVYQAYLQKGFSELASSLKLGRFQRADNLGFYYLDGADYRYAPKESPFSLNVYGGKPGRMEHVRSLQGDALFGFEGAGHFLPQWRTEWLPLTLEEFDLRLGYQRFADRQAVDRITLAGTAAGRVRLCASCKYEAMASGTYRADRQKLENVWLSGQLDLTKTLRWRASYEEYKPRNPFPTFRERFYTAYALGEQTLAKASFHHQAAAGWTYYVGGQYATRQIGDSGQGAYAGLRLAQWPGVVLGGEFDYLELGRDRAESFYLTASHSPSAQWRVQANAALRFEHKPLYGENRAVGGEIEVQYRVKNNIVLMATGTQIFNTRIQDEYLAAVQMIYYFDNFKPKPY